MKIRFLIPFLLPAALMAQTCTPSGTVLNAATCSQADVNACFSAVSNTTTVINIPSGTCHWTGIPAGTLLALTVPSGNTNLKIAGNTTVSCTGSAGTSSYACTPTDNTVIVDDIAANFGVLQINGSSSASNPLVEVTGITIQNGTGGNKFQGQLLFYSNSASSQIRIDHDHFNLTTGTSGTGWVGRLNGCFTGVGDHNVFDNASTSATGTVAQGFMNSNTCNDSLGFGDGSWATATGFGGSNFFFWENNVFNGGLFGDCILGGKFVSRYNTFNSNSQSSSWIHNHGTALNGGRVRGCRAFEAYQNYFNPATAASGGFGSVMVGDAGGTGLIWGNTLSKTGITFLAVGDERNDGQHGQTPTPNGWGTCGVPAGGPSSWDENVDSSGRACIDGIGRGKGLQALNGQNFPTALNSTTGTIAWPQEYLEPVYAWMNTLVGTPPLSIASSATAQNRDVYMDNASFNGSTGTGFGTHAARIALGSCTAGPGGTYGTSPTGSYGVGFWETDTSTFWVCTAANTWTNIYSPYTYPHPLVSGGGVSLTVNIAGSGAAGSTVTGTNSSSGTYAVGTTIGPLTANPAAGATFTSWSVTGSALCSGATNPCPSFPITLTTTVTATFTAATPTCGVPFENAPFGGTYSIPPSINVTLTSPTPGCGIVYTATTNGSTPATPNCSSTAYPGGGFTLSSAAAYKYRWMACQTGYTPSSVVGDEWLVLNIATPQLTIILISQNADRELRAIREWKGFR